MNTTVQFPEKAEPSPSHEELGRRRPMKVRESSLCTRIASSLSKAGVTPNQVSMTGLAAGLGVGLALMLTNQVQGAAMEKLCWGVAILCMILRGAGNILDGVVAVECGRSTPVGHLYNEVPDRLSDIAMLVGAGYAVGGHIELGWMAAVAALFVAYTRVQVDVAGARQSFIGPAAKPARVAFVAAAALIHIAAPTWVDRCMSSLGGWGPVSVALAAIVVGGIITAIRRLMTAAGELNRGQAS